VSVVVTLNPVEVEVAVVVGTARAKISRKSGFEDRSHVADAEERLNRDIDGAGAEIAASKATGLRWSMSCGVDLRQPDLEGGVEVRSTTRDRGGLIVRRRDRGDRIALLVVGSVPTFRIAGWARIEDARRDEFKWRDVWLMPQCRLAPFTAFQTRTAA
jgi:hypothetical protein